MSPSDRRTFVKTAASAALGAGLIPGIARATPPLPAPPAPQPPVSPALQSLNILILGGTGFTGPEQVEYALARGHKVTLLNRNQRRPDLFKGRVDQLVGDLNADVSALKGRKFDVVIDNPTTFPAWVRNAAQYLKGNTGQYIFISTISVYRNSNVLWADESDPTTPMPDGVDPYTLVPQHASQYYGALKTFAEQEVEKHYPGIATIVRPGLIVGPLDPSDRFTYWAARVDKGGEVLAPGDGTDSVQVIDCRDLAEWMVRMAESRTVGTYNATGPEKPFTMAEMLYGIKAVTTAGAQFTWVPQQFLVDQKVRGWSNMPVWVPQNDSNRGFLRRGIQKALKAGLTFRPFATTAHDTIEWNKTRPPEELERLAQGARAGIPAARESELLAAWKVKQAGG
ncbi:MAG: NAD-dependent epimerase/dehydratase family protein [Gemmatimonadota bacterium]|nr:NAD-dependent epimerase/dehydratase family protein [Gemmatimonadota bacterium]